MSSCGNPSTEGDTLMPRRLKFDKGRDCIKCKVNRGKLVIRHAVYCKECFTPLVTMKFRRSLEPFVNANAGTSKRPKLKASGSLVLGFSGGLGSSILLDMVHKTYFATDPSNLGIGSRGGTNHPRTANVWATCTVCYVEVCNAFPEARDRTKEVEAILTSYPKFTFIPLRLEHAFDESWWCTVTTTEHNFSKLALELDKDGLFTEALKIASFSNRSPTEALCAYLGSLPTQTAVSSAIRVLIRLLLLYTAQSRRASHLLLGTSLTTLSVSLISSISLGGGYMIQEELQEEWCSVVSTTYDKTDYIRVVRPLRDVTMKECALFAWWNSIPVVGRDKQSRANAGILGLTKDFIVGLEKDYPSTVSTIARTCAKLEPKTVSRNLCMLCQRPIQDGLEDWQSRISTRSYLDAKLVPDLVYLATPVPKHVSETLAISSQCPSISAQLCYFCHTMFTSRSTRAPRPAGSNVAPEGQLSPSAPLPLWTSASYARVCTQDGLSRDDEAWVRKVPDETEKRSMIADFLLDT